MKTKETLLASAILALVSAGTATASDAVKASVTPNTPPSPIVVQNGTGLTPGLFTTPLAGVGPYNPATTTLTYTQQ